MSRKNRRGKEPKIFSQPNNTSLSEEIIEDLTDETPSFITLRKQLLDDLDLLAFLKENRHIDEKDKKQLKKEINRFLRTEMFLYVVDLIQSELSLIEASSLFVLKYEPLISFENSKDKTLAKKLRRILMLRYPITHNPQIWYERVQDYMEYPAQLRLFREEKTPQPTLVYEPDQYTRSVDRLAAYRELLEDHIEKPETPLKQVDLSLGKTLYYSAKEHPSDEKTKIISVPLPDSVVDLIQNGIDLSPYQLSNYEEKPSLQIPKDFSVEKMLERVAGEKDKLPLIRFTYPNGQEKLDLTGVSHILGALGVGKSNFKYGMTDYFLNGHPHSDIPFKKANRIAIIEDKVTTVFDVVKKLRKMGINAIPIIGKDDEKHFNTLLKDVSPEQYSITNENDELFRTIELSDWVSGECFILSGQANFTSETQEAPCTRLKQNKLGLGPSVCCPYATLCGRMKRYRDMKEAEVWVTTVPSLLTANIPHAFNPNKRTFFELIYDNVDLVFFDEVDGTQDILDNGFLKDNPLLNGYELSSNLKQLRTRIEKNFRLPETPPLMIGLTEFERARTHFNELLFNCASARYYLEKNILTLKSMTYQITNRVDTEKTTPENLNRLQMELKVLSSIANIHFITSSRDQMFENELQNNIWYGPYQKINQNYETKNNKEDYREYNDFLKAIEKNYQSMGIHFKKNDPAELKLIYEMTAIFVALVDVDRFYKMIVTECDIIRTSNPTLMDNLHDLKLNPLLISNFTLEPLLEDMRYGYLFKEIEGKNTYQLELHQYSGVGRKILFTLSDIKSDLGQKGPAVIGLSGTSFFKDSLKYNFIKEPDLLLESINKDGSIRKEGSMKIHYIPKVSSKMPPKGKSVTQVPYTTITQGGSETSKRLEQYYEILKHLDGANDVKINYLEQATEGKKPSILVTGNYDEAEGVHQWLLSHGYQSIGLVREAKEGEFILTRGDVEGIATNEQHKDAKFLVVSLESIARGYNILNETFDSHFGSVFFLTRPYPQPLSLANSLKKTHALYDYIVEDLKEDVELTLSEKLYDLYVRNALNFDNAYHLGYWNDLTELQKRWISADALVPIKQMIGRTQRNQNNTTVYFCDGSFSPRENKDFMGTSKGDSMFDCWLYSLKETIEQHPFGASLFGEFYRALTEMVEEYRGK